MSTSHADSKKELEALRNEERLHNISLRIQTGGDEQKLTVGPNFAKLIHPFRLMASGPTNCGKSYFCLNVLKHMELLIDVEFERVIYACAMCMYFN